MALYHRLSNYHRKIVGNRDIPFYLKMPVLTISSWLFQGVLYMDTTERDLKLLLDVLIFLPLFFVFNHYFSNVFTGFIAIVIAHTINWVFNGQIFVLLKNLKLVSTSHKLFVEYLNDIKRKVENEDSITAVAAFGSLSREELKKTSDLDIRIIRKPGIMNGIKACVFVLKERTESFFRGFPLDIYVLDNFNLIHKHIQNENPILIYDPTKIFEKNLIRGISLENNNCI